MQCIAGVAWGVQAHKIQRLSLVTPHELISTTVRIPFFPCSSFTEYILHRYGSLVALYVTFLLRAIWDIMYVKMYWICITLSNETKLAAAKRATIPKTKTLTHSSRAHCRRIGYSHRSVLHCLMLTPTISRVLTDLLSPALLATIELVLFLTFPHKPYHACITFILTKIYSNSLLVVFNSQIRIVGARNWEPETDTSLDAQNDVVCDTLSHVRGGNPGSEIPMRIALGSKETDCHLRAGGAQNRDGWNDVIHLDRKVSYAIRCAGRIFD